jgi:tetratricopeptide (TPR) repeat protein
MRISDGLKVRNWLLCVVAIAMGLTLVAVVGVFAEEERDKDYFDPEAQGLLGMVEQYHLVSGTPFWSYYKNIDRDYSHALNELKFILRYFPNHPKALTLLGVVAKQVQVPMLPIPYFEKALVMYPQHAITHAQFGAYLVEIDKVDRGIEVLKTAVKIDPKLEAAYGWLAGAYKKKGDTHAAEQAQEESAKLGLRGRDSSSPSMK